MHYYSTLTQVTPLCISQEELEEHITEARREYLEYATKQMLAARDPNQPVEWYGDPSVGVALEGTAHDNRVSTFGTGTAPWALLCRSHLACSHAGASKTYTSRNGRQRTSVCSLESTHAHVTLVLVALEENC